MKEVTVVLVGFKTVWYNIIINQSTLCIANMLMNKHCKLFWNRKLRNEIMFLFKFRMLTAIVNVYDNVRWNSRGYRGHLLNSGTTQAL